MRKWKSKSGGGGVNGFGHVSAGAGPSARPRLYGCLSTPLSGAAAHSASLYRITTRTPVATATQPYVRAPRALFLHLHPHCLRSSSASTTIAFLRDPRVHSSHRRRILSRSRKPGLLVLGAWKPVMRDQAARTVSRAPWPLKTAKARR